MAAGGLTCWRCGVLAPPSARFCASCAAELAAPAPVAEVRKTVTALFCDVAGSTELGRRLDAEVMRGVMEQYFAVVSRVLSRHGGTVEKFVGDAVMAVFGVPIAHEDDALRACRAATQMSEAVQELDRSVAQAQGVRLEVRIGIETGEAMVGDQSRGSTFASGTAVNTAARLQQASGPGECLIGPGCYRLVRDLAAVKDRPGLALKGIAGTVNAYFLLGVREPDGAGSVSAALVGRSRELALLGQAFDRAVNDRTCQLATVLGPAGMGKTRLAAEFMSSVSGQARVLRGRCVSYGEGLTYWPLVEAVRQAADLSGTETEQQARAALTGLLGDLPDATEVVERVAPVAGLGGVPGALEDTAWAVQRLLEVLAATRPVVLVVDDLHWAEVGLLDVVEGVCDWSRDAPILVAVFARPEFIDDHPGWGAGRVNSVTALLEPLGDGEVDALTGALLGGVLPDDAADRVRASAGGNPLFVEQLLAMLVEDGVLRRAGPRWVLDGDVHKVQIPPTISALLTARLDRLSTEERAVLGPAAVIGQVFYRGAVSELSTVPVDQVSVHIKTLLRKGLVRPTSSDLAGQDAIRFGHVLIRDAAYGALPKSVRADLHERFARWLDKQNRGQAVDDFVGSHLESAYQLRAELGALDEAARRLGQEAAERLAAAGQLMLAADDPAAIALLTRALALQPDEGQLRWSIQFDLVDGLLRDGNLIDAAEVAESIRVAAEAAGDLQWTTRARLATGRLGLYIASEGATELLRNEAQQALVVFGRLGDELGLGVAHECLADVAAMSGRVDALATENQLAAEHLTRAGRGRLAQALTLGTPLFAMEFGSRPASLGLVEARRRVATAQGRLPRIYAWVAVSFFAAMLDRTEEERQAREHAEQLQVELRNSWTAAWMMTHLGVAALACGRPADAAELFAGASAVHEATGAAGLLSTTAGYHAHALLLIGDQPEARRQVDRALETGSTDDVLTQGLARSALAWLTAVDGDDPAIVQGHMTDALAALEPTDLVMDLAFVYAACAEAAQLLGDDKAARQHRQRAIDLYDTKENIVGAAVQRALLAGEV